MLDSQQMEAASFSSRRGPAPYALPSGVPALERDPARCRALAISGAALLAAASACGGFVLGRLSRAEPATIQRAQNAAMVDDQELMANASSVLVAAPRVPDDVDIGVALDRLARRALADRAPEGAVLARRLLAALSAGARALEPHRHELERRARRG